ncbi:MAG: type I DNA topoisomerase [Candidatus Omnitrophota bacterium]|nr:type I DNA topoisomerase [Candidatus Omnitrophota bacterium]
MPKSSKSLVIVESPAKAKTINKILGKKFVVESSMGHLVDLPKTALGVDIENNFTPSYVVVHGKQKILTKLKKEAKGKEKIYLATDPDREGEAIGWHLMNKIGGKAKFFRVVFHEITKEAVEEAFNHPREIDLNLINSQVARRILDRIVGYQLSPLLWKKVGSRLSAGRVQSVALRFIVEREQEIKAFKPQEYWQVEAQLKKHGVDEIFFADLEKIDGKKIELVKKDQTEKVVAELEKEKFTISDIQQKSLKRNPGPPFITSSLQQAAFNQLGFTATRTMMVAQQLYEGIELGEEAVGLITYMRTDSFNVATSAIDEVRQFISKNFGKDYLPDKPNFFKSRKSAQEAHEAIRPSKASRTPEDIKQFLTEEQYKLYELIWKKFVGSQMSPAVYFNTRVDIKAGRANFVSTGTRLIFAGFTALKDVDEVQKEKILPELSSGEILDLVKLLPSQHFTKPPPRYSDGTLVKVLEEKGIGRPSTYAPIIQTIVYRNYVCRDKGYFTPTELGFLICELLVEYFSTILDIEFTAKMEEELDMVEEGKLEWHQLLNEFYVPFKKGLDYAQENMKKTLVYSDRYCPQCGKRMIVKWGRHGRFLSCSGFPACRFAEAFTTGVKCPQEGCGGELLERRSKRGSVFYGCSHYPKCNFMSRRLPTSEEPKKEELED